MTDSSNITLGFERGTAFYIGQSQIVRSSMFLLRGFFFELGGCNYDGQEKGKEEEGEDHENGSRRMCTHICRAHHILLNFNIFEVTTAANKLHNRRLWLLLFRPPSLPACVLPPASAPASTSHTAQTTLLPRRSAKGSPPHTDKLPAGSPLVLGYRGAGLSRGGVRYNL